MRKPALRAYLLQSVSLRAIIYDAWAREMLWKACHPNDTVTTK